jgi:hypothetical protein
MRYLTRQYEACMKIAYILLCFFLNPFSAVVEGNDVFTLSMTTIIESGQGSVVTWVIFPINASNFVCLTSPPAFGPVTCEVARPPGGRIEYIIAPAESATILEGCHSGPTLSGDIVCRVRFSNPQDAPRCGDGIINQATGSEQCDGPDLGGKTCITATPGCTPEICSGDLACFGLEEEDPAAHLPCAFDFRDCEIHDRPPEVSLCGNGIIEGTEQCEFPNLSEENPRLDLQGETCLSLGFAGGTLGCSLSAAFEPVPVIPSCQFDTSACTTSASCGNGVLEEGEECEANDHGGATCVSLGFDSGFLTCDDCAFDTSECSTVIATMRTITVKKSASAPVTYTSTPAGINCPPGCAEQSVQFPIDVEVQIHATSANNSNLNAPD